MDAWSVACAAALALPPVLCVVCLVLTRVSIGSVWQPICQCGFLSCMLILAAAMLGSLAFNYGVSLGYGTSLAVMAVGAVWDGGTASRFLG